jgi:hypothetical protein
MSEIERLMSEFTAIAIAEARVDSISPAGVTVCFLLAPTPVPVQWKVMFSNLSHDKAGSVMSTSDPLLHGNDVVWTVSEGDIPNAKQYVHDHVTQANALFTRMLSDAKALRLLRESEMAAGEIERLQRVLDAS